MTIKQHVRRSLVRQFHHPTGLGGHAAGLVMGRRSSNVQRNRWAVDLLDIQPDDRVIEFGCGPGVAVAAVAARATRGLVVGVDQSEVMIRHARRRNAAAVRAGRVRLIHAPIEDLDMTDEPFDAALAVNTTGIWPDPVERLREIARRLCTGGRIALVSQPRSQGATAATSATAADHLSTLLTQAGFEDLRVEMLELNPPAVCVLAMATADEGRHPVALGES